MFNDKIKLKQLTNILHPLVFDKYNSWIDDNKNYPYTIHESAIIFEYSQQSLFDKTICVTAPYDLRIKRILERDKTDIIKVKKRIDNQMTESQKTNLSDIIINNDEKSFLIPQVLEIHNKLTKK